MCWQCGRTDRLHFCQLSLVFDDGAVEFLLLCSQLQLQLPVLLLLPVYLGASAPVAPPHCLPPLHHLSQLVDGLGEKNSKIVLYRDLFMIKYEFCKYTGKPTGISMLRQEFSASAAEHYS